MFHLQEEVENDDLPCSFSPVAATRATDFRFWEDRIREGNENNEEDGYTAYSPPLWSRKAANGSYPTPTSRFHAAQKCPMEMPAPYVPELSYELSLRDIVSDEQQRSHDHAEVVGQKNVDMKVHEGKIVIAQKAKRKKSKNLRRRQISRSESMNSGVFLLKMFIPASLCSNKKTPERNVNSNVVRSPSFDGFLKAVNTDWWKINLLSDTKNSTTSSSSSSGCGSRGSTSSISSTRSRDAENEINVKSGCCSLSWDWDPKPKRQSRCLLF